MAETGTFTIDTTRNGLAARVLVRYELLGHGMCPVCRRGTLAVVVVHHPAAGDYAWTNCDHCSGGQP